MSSVRVRFAPSPTGFLHVGGLRTALYNYLFARRNNGVFILRIEDTDRTRFVEGAVENLIASLRWAGLDYDEGPVKGGSAGPYVQSERNAIYLEHALKLIECGKAYYAFETEEELDQIRKESESKGNQPAYDGRALRLTAAEVQKKLKAGLPHVIRMKTPDSGTVIIDDQIRGMVEFDVARIDDQVLIKSDGFPTYHLANVVDDHLMGITDVIRGEEWLPSTPKHALLYSYFNWDPPRFAHLPLLLNPDRSKMSKRRMQDGKQVDVFVEEYRHRGYLPEALVNFVALLGWNPGTEQEVFSLEELSREFSLDRVGKAGAIFDIAKLDWMNGTYIRALPPRDLAQRMRPFVEEAGITGVSDEYLLAASQLMRDRCESLSCLTTSALYLFKDPAEYDEQSRKKNWKPESGAQIRELLKGFEGLDAFAHAEIEGLVRATAERLGVGAGKLIHPLRLALTGVSAGPGLFELMTVLGKETCIRRVELAVTRLG